MITRKQKRSILYILFVFILCSAAKDFEFLVLKTDETFLAENIFCKIFAILVISQCLVERKLSWRSIGFRLKGIKKGLILGFSLGLSTFAISYLAEFLILFFMGKSPRLSFYISNFALSDQTVTGISLSALLICILGNVINVTAEEGLFRGLIFKLGRRAFSTRSANFIQALLFGIWHLVIVTVWFKEGSLTLGAAFLMGIGYIILAGILGFEWGLCVTLTGTIWTGIFEHFFNNFISNSLHVVTDTGADELQILRIVLSNILSLLLVLFLMKRSKKRKRRSPEGRRTSDR